MNVISDLFGTMVFNEDTMREHLPEDIFTKVLQSMNTGSRMSRETADVVADAMKDWAIEKGATHFTHWFQPMTGITAEKHDSFIKPAGNGRVINEFSGKELIQGEPDASSFPSGGLRATFEARGYTTWDPTSYAFIKENVLCIPTAFCSYGGEALDKKTPLLRSMEAVNREALRVLRLFGHTDVCSVKASVGPEQEYFLIDSSVFEKRRDLIYTGRTLFGARPPKGQELDDHYFGAIKPRVLAFMKELNEELWKLGIMAKTEHNETAPAQHELAPVFTTVNISADHNQLTMELMRKIAARHGMTCLLHEKPFAGVNGSGKHNNWSLATDTGINLLEPGKTPYENAQFLLFLCAVIQATDDYQDLLRLSVASAGNDHRLGASEAPPAIISMSVGEELEEILTAIKNDAPYGGRTRELIKVGVHALPKIPRDTTDRNRTSPLAFTGNKFEFRMVGSSASISGANVVLNTAVAESLRQYADILEKAENFESELHSLIQSVIRKHDRILFSGNGYGADWTVEAKRRGLLNLPSTPDCVPYYLADKNVELFTRHGVYSEKELHSRYEIKLEGYTKVLVIEANTMLEMVLREIFPAVSKFSSELAAAIAVKAQAGGFGSKYEAKTIKELSELMDKGSEQADSLEKALADLPLNSDCLSQAVYARDFVLKCMNELRSTVDAMEIRTSASAWPFPTYGDLLFSIK